MRTIADGVTKDTTLCIFLSGRPGNTGTRFHNYLYDALGLDYVYKAFTTADITAAVAGIRGLGIRGAGISMPFKEAVIPLVDELEPSARAIDSVNMIVNTDGHLVAYNTDYLAIASLLASHAVPTDGEVAVLGSGGMAKATVAALRDHGYGGVVVARNPEAGPPSRRRTASTGRRRWPIGAPRPSSTAPRWAWRAAGRPTPYPSNWPSWTPPPSSSMSCPGPPGRRWCRPAKSAAR